VIQPYIDWLAEWNEAQDSELQIVMDKLDDVIVSLIGDCESEGIDTGELRSLLTRHRNYKTRILNKRMDIAEELDLLLKRITGDRFRLQTKRTEGATDTTKGLPHPWEAWAIESKGEERRDRAMYVFSKLDGNKQKDMLAEFKECKEYRGKRYSTAKECVIAKIMRFLESKRA
jgi:hypothetical protein